MRLTRKKHKKIRRTEDKKMRKFTREQQYLLYLFRKCVSLWMKIPDRANGACGGKIGLYAQSNLGMACSYMYSSQNKLHDHHLITTVTSLHAMQGTGVMLYRALVCMLFVTFVGQLKKSQKPMISCRVTKSQQCG